MIFTLQTAILGTQTELLMMLSCRRFNSFVDLFWLVFRSVCSYCTVTKHYRLFSVAMWEAPGFKYNTSSTP